MIPPSSISQMEILSFVNLQQHATSVPIFQYDKEGAVGSVLIHEDSLVGRHRVVAIYLHGVIGVNIHVGPIPGGLWGHKRGGRRSERRIRW